MKFTPQPIMPPQQMPKRSTMPRKALHLRRRLGMPTSSRQANEMPPASLPGIPLRLASANVAVTEKAVVVIVSVPVPEAVPVMLTGLVVPKLSVGGS